MSIKGGTLFDYFSTLPDPRTGNAKRHCFGDIAVISICAVLCGADSFVEIAAFGKAKKTWLSTFLPLPNDIPSHDTFSRVFALLDPKAFEELFHSWVLHIVKELEENTIIAIDGKTVRRSHDRKHDLGPLHLVSAFAVQNGLVLTERAVDTKSNEMKAIPKLLETLSLKGCIATIDAGGCYKEIVQTVTKQGGDYVIAVKKNQSTLLKNIENLFLTVPKKYEQQTTEIDLSHGRTQQRTCVLVSDIDILNKFLKTRATWPSIQSVIKIQSTRTIRKKITTESRYYISSIRDSSPQKMLTIIRGHWGIENSLHWVLDIAFREDESRIRIGHAQENFALLRKISFNILKRETNLKIGMKGKRLNAAWDENYLLQLLKMYEV